MPESLGKFPASEEETKSSTQAIDGISSVDSSALCQLDKPWNLLDEFRKNQSGSECGEARLKA